LLGVDCVQNKCVPGSKDKPFDKWKMDEMKSNDAKTEIDGQVGGK